MDWLKWFDERQVKEIKFACMYASEFNHGTTGHNALIVIAKLANQLDAIHFEKTAWNLEERARIAYRAYGQVTDFKNYLGLPMPEWEELTDKIREAWTAAASANA